MTYHDTLTLPAMQVSPENEMSGIGSLVNHTVRNITHRLGNDGGRHEL